MLLNACFPKAAVEQKESYTSLFNGRLRIDLDRPPCIGPLDDLCQTGDTDYYRPKDPWILQISIFDALYLRSPKEGSFKFAKLTLVCRMLQNAGGTVTLKKIGFGDMSI